MMSETKDSRHLFHVVIYRQNRLYRYGRGLSGVQSRVPVPVAQTVQGQLSYSPLETDPEDVICTLTPLVNKVRNGDKSSNVDFMSLCLPITRGEARLQNALRSGVCPEIYIQSSYLGDGACSIHHVSSLVVTSERPRH